MAELFLKKMVKEEKGRERRVKTKPSCGNSPKKKVVERED